MVAAMRMTLVLALSMIVAAGGEPVLSLSTNVVARQAGIELRIEWTKGYTNPFDPAEVRMDLEVTHASGERFQVPAFYAQDYQRARSGGSARGPAWLYPLGSPGWRARFAPFLEGEHQAVARVKDAKGEYASAPVRWMATASTSTGYVRVSRGDPRFLELRPLRSELPGRPFFPIGQNLAFIGDDQYVSLDRAEEILSKLSANGANYLRIWTCCGDWAIAIEARKNAFGRSWGGKGPIVRRPDDPGRFCLRLSRTNATVDVNPSHRVALRAETAYELKGRWRGSGAGLRLEVRGQRAQWPPGKPEWQPFSLRFRAGPEERWLGKVVLGLEGEGELLAADLSLKEASGGAELLWEADLDRPALGVYNQPDCFMVDELVRAAERQGIYLQLCLLTRDLYLKRLQDPASADYTKAIAEAKNFMRYAVARWGYSTAVATWEYWNEMDPGKPTERFYRELGEFLDTTDIYGHLKSTSTWGPCARDCRQQALSLADAHFYLRPADEGQLEDEVQAVLDRAQWLRQQAPGKPALLDEFGIADNQWRLRPEMNGKGTLADVHNALWASALSGLSGTAMEWWWERLDQQQVYGLYRPLSRFLETVPWTTGQLAPAQITSTNAALRVAGLQSRGQRGWVWIFHTGAAWKARVQGRPRPQVNAAGIEVHGLQPGTWDVEWFDTRRGEVVRRELRPTTAGVLRLSAPAFEGDVACRMTASPTTRQAGPSH